MRVNGRVEVGGGQVVELPALLDHPFDHPDDPTGPVWTRRDRVDTACMRRRPSSPEASSVGRVTLTLHGPIGELAAALRTLADALDHEQATSLSPPSFSWVRSNALAPLGWSRDQAWPMRRPGYCSRDARS
jgi:hypothetical protein